MVRRLVEDEQVHAAGLQQRQRGAGPLARGQRRRRPQHVVAARSPNFASSVRTSAAGQSGSRVREGVDQRLVAERTARAPGRPRRRRRPGPSGRCPSSSGEPAEQRARAGSTCPPPFGPVIATRSAQSICRSTGPRVNAPRRTTAPRSGRDDRARPRRGGDLHPQLPLLARLLDHVEPLDQPLGLAGLGGLLLARLGRGTCGRSCRCPWPCAGRSGRPSPSRRAGCGPAPRRSARVSAYSSYVLAGMPRGPSRARPDRRRSRRRRP